MKSVFSVLLFAPLLAGSVVPGRYIVELSGESVAEHAQRLHGKGARARAAILGAEGRQHRAVLRAEQTGAASRIAREEGTVLGRLDTVHNALLVSIPDEKADRLALVPGVRKVYPVRQVKMLMDRVTALHRATEVWSTVGFDRAGAGVKIAIIDSGIDNEHPAFQDPSLPMPDGFPRANTDADLVYTSRKIIVARSYAAYFRFRDPDRTPQDHVGHGTATAMCAAGVTNTGPLATITGVAPKAWIGNYKIFGTPGINDGGTDDAVLKAVDDAVADGMDVLSLSFGTNVAPRFEDDPEVVALERAAGLGLIVVVAGGNNGPDRATINSPAIAPSVIAVGASYNDRTFVTTARVGDAEPFTAIPGNGRTPPAPITAPLFDVERLDGNGLACSAFPAGSLKGYIAFILRGDCTFDIKLGNARAAGAVAALLYTHQNEPQPVSMQVGTVTDLPAEMVSNADGLAIKALFGGGSLTATLQFTPGPVYVDPARLAGFSAKGPNIDYSVKPDLVAAGVNIYTAAQKLDSRGELYNLSGYSLEQGTSFSTPIVAGAAALLKAARPGLTAAQYRSLLVNSAAPASLAPGTPARVQQAGAGVLDVAAALNLTVTAVPSSLSFGVRGEPPVTRTLAISNVGAAAETFTLTAAPAAGGPVPEISPATVRLEPRASAAISFKLTGAGTAPGEYDGFIFIQPASSSQPARVPYWFASPSNVPASIAIVDYPEDARPGSRATIYFKVLDAAGVPMNTIEPEVTAITDLASVGLVRSVDLYYPDVWSASVRLSSRAGSNLFHIKAGEATRDVNLPGN
jgi:minor extracellular serine protease Vpr